MVTNNTFHIPLFTHRVCLLLICLMLAACGDNTPSDKLLKAAANGDIGTMKKWIDQGADINYQSSGMLSLEQTPLMKAAKNGHLEAVKFLIDKGADISKGNTGKENPITLAAEKDHPEVVLYLIAKGESVNYQESNYGMTALHYAARNGNLDLIEKLVAKGANMKLQNKEQETPFGVAVFYKKLGPAKYFLIKGANPNQMGRHKVPLIMHAASTTRRDRHMLPPDVKAMVNLLLGAGANINQQDLFGNTALIRAATKGRVGIMNFLIKQGADESIANNQGATARSVFGSRVKK